MSKFSETGVIIRENSGDSLGALSAATAVRVGQIDGSLQEDFRILKSEIAARLVALTAGEGAGLLFGICNAELTAAEIAECLTTSGPLDKNDRLLKERAGRWVKVLSQYDPTNTLAVAGLFKNKTGGPIIESKDRWTYSDPEGWAYFVFNDGATLTTGASVLSVATHYGVWVQ